jgi:hypothetical protein
LNEEKMTNNKNFSPGKKLKSGLIQAPGYFNVFDIRIQNYE